MPGPKLPDLRIRRTRATLREALLALLREKPFDQITIREITARGGVGYASYFRHYPNKDALLHAVAEEEIGTLIERTLPMVATDNRSAALELCRYVSEQAATWTALLSGGAAGLIRAEFLRQAMAVETPISPLPWLPRDLAITYSVSSTFEILAWWLPRRDEFAVENVARILDQLIMTPLTLR